jgi:hypothetical protein
MSDGIKSIWHLARHIPRLIGPFIPIADAFIHGVTIDSTLETPPNLPTQYVSLSFHAYMDRFILSSHSLSEAQQIQHARYRKILAAIPTMDDLIQFMVKTDILAIGELASFVRACYLLRNRHLCPQKLEQAANEGHAKDLETLRNHAYRYIPSIEEYQGTSPFNNFAIARLLCPRHMRDVFDSDKEEFCHLVQSGFYDFSHHLHCKTESY